MENTVRLNGLKIKRVTTAGMGEQGAGVSGCGWGSESANDEEHRKAERMRTKQKKRTKQDRNPKIHLNLTLKDKKTTKQK